MCNINILIASRSRAVVARQAHNLKVGVFKSILRNQDYYSIDLIGTVFIYKLGVRHITLLSHPTSSTIINSYIRNRPMLCKRKDIGGKISNMSIHPDDLQIIETVSKRKLQYSKSFNKKYRKKQSMNPYRANAY